MAKGKIKLGLAQPLYRNEEAIKMTDCPCGVARPAKQPEFQLVLHQG